MICWSNPTRLQVRRDSALSCLWWSRRVARLTAISSLRFPSPTTSKPQRIPLPPFLPFHPDTETIQIRSLPLPTYLVSSALWLRQTTMRREERTCENNQWVRQRTQRASRVKSLTLPLSHRRWGLPSFRFHQRLTDGVYEPLSTLHSNRSLADPRHPDLSCTLCLKSTWSSI